MAVPRKLPEDEAYYTIGEVAEALRVSYMTIYRAIEAGHIRTIRVGRSFRISHSSYEEYKKGNKQT